MKNFFIFFALLLLCACKARPTTPDNENDFLQSEVTGSIGVARETDNQLPMSERINLLFIASYYSQTNAIARLVEGGVPVNSTNSAGVTALMWVPQGTRYAYYANADFGAANYLISHGAKPEAKDKNGRTAADYAFEYGHYNLLPILDFEGKYKPFYVGAGGTKSSVQDQLIQIVGELSIESMSCGSNLPPKPDKVKIISDALKAGAYPNQEIFLTALGGSSSEDYWLPLSQIMPEAILELVKGGAKVNEPLSNGLQPLFYTVSKPALFKMLLNAGADPNKASHVAWADWSDVRKNLSPSPKLKFIREPIICEAAQFGVPETLQMLLDCGVSIEEGDSRGNTPLLCAVNFANVDAINFLLKHHASLTATNSVGQNALDMAAARMNVDFVRVYDKKGQYRKILEDYPGDPKSPVVGKWARESSTNLFLRIDAKGGGEIEAGREVFHNWKKTLAWKKTAEKAIEISVYCPEIPRMPGDELEPGWLDYHSETDTCVLRWRDGPQPSAVKFVRMK